MQQRTKKEHMHRIINIDKRTFAQCGARTHDPGIKSPMLYRVGRRGRCVKHWSRTPADPGSIPGAGDKNKRLISLPCNIRRCAPRGSHIT